MAYQDWLRTQPGVISCYLTREPKTGKMTSVTVWANRDKFAAMRYGKPPTDAIPLPAVTVEISEVLG
jgi:heme-degrading monooxygenase HmoA